MKADFRAFVAHDILAVFPRKSLPIRICAKARNAWFGKGKMALALLLLATGSKPRRDVSGWVTERD